MISTRQMNLVEGFPDIKLTDGSGCQTAIQLLIDVLTTRASEGSSMLFGVHPNRARTEGGRGENYRM
jgi:hypothetical protein